MDVEDFPYPLPVTGNHLQGDINNILLQRGPYFIHEEGSPYLGLPIEQQKILAKMRRGDGRTPAWRLKEMRTATKKDYENLLLRCTETLIEAWIDNTQRLDRTYVYMRLPFNFRTYYNESMPRPFIIGYDDWTIVARFNLDKIVSWLYTLGHSPYNAAELRKSVWAILKEQKRLDLYYEVASDQSIIELYSEIIDDTKNKRNGVKKGRGEYALKKPLDKSEN